MRYRYVITRDDAEKKVLITELSHLSDEGYAPTGKCEINGPDMEEALKKGLPGIMELLRRDTFFPPQNAAEAISGALADLFGEKGRALSEISVDEVDVEPQETKDDSEDEDEDDEDDDLDDDDDILDDDDDDDFDGDDASSSSDEDEPEEEGLKLDETPLGEGDDDEDDE